MLFKTIIISPGSIRQMHVETRGGEVCQRGTGVPPVRSRARCAGHIQTTASVESEWSANSRLSAVCFRDVTLPESVLFGQPRVCIHNL